MSTGSCEEMPSVRDAEEIRSAYEIVSTLHDDAAEDDEGVCRVDLVREISTGAVRVCKNVDASNQCNATKRLLLGELKALQMLKHPHIVELHGHIIEASAGKLVLFLEHLDGGNCAQLIASQGAADRVAAQVVLHVLQALSHCHAQGVVHRDVKAENIVASSCSNGKMWKLIDFGVAAICSHPSTYGSDQFQNETLRGNFGDPRYAAPEMVASDTSTYGAKVDVWAVGVLYFLLLTGKMPFGDMEARVNKVRTQIRRFAAAATGDADREQLLRQAADAECWADLCEGARDLLIALLHPDKTCRHTSAAISGHRWLAASKRPSLGGS